MAISTSDTNKKYTNFSKLTATENIVSLMIITLFVVECTIVEDISIKDNIINIW